MNVRYKELPVRDVKNLHQKTHQMVDKSEVQSTASSDISESLRETILGKGYNRRRYKPATKTVKEISLSSYEVIPSKESWDIISPQRGSVIGEDREASYHTAPTGSDRSFKKENSFEVIPERHSNSAPMQQLNENKRHYTTIETQTVAIQTVAVGTDSIADCSCGDCQCNCLQCIPADCPFCRKHENLVEEGTDASTFENYTETSCQTVNIKGPNRCMCDRCRNKRGECETTSVLSLTDSDDSYTTDFFDLPYQNNEEYLKVLRELEKKLIARNRERVRRTMMEFEKRSRQNQNLEKPICDYSGDESVLLRKIAAKASGKNGKCCKCGRNKRVNSDILQNEKNWDEINFVQSIIHTDDKKCPISPNRIERSSRKSHWQMDPRTGEWVKVSSFHQADYARHPVHGDYKQVGPPGKKECCCRQKKIR